MIQTSLRSLRPGDTLAVTGTCRENVMIPPEATGITLNGQNRSTIQHPRDTTTTGASRHVVYVRGRAITIAGFTIRDGQDGIHLSGPASAVIRDNQIISNRGRGIHMDKGSVAQIIGNRIRENGGEGIHITENSYARIGFLIPPDRVLRPNSIENNGAGGVLVERTSGAWLVGNTIRGNGGPGIAIDRHSEADVLANAISGNRGDGIKATRESGVNLNSEGTQRTDGPNQTDPSLKNSGVGVSCSVGGYASGPLGTLTGIRGTKEFDSTCIDRVTIP